MGKNFIFSCFKNKVSSPLIMSFLYIPQGMFLIFSLYTHTSFHKIIFDKHSGQVERRSFGARSGQVIFFNGEKSTICDSKDTLHDLVTCWQQWCCADARQWLQVDLLGKLRGQRLVKSD